MKRLVVVLSSLLVLPAFAEVTPSQYDTDMTFSDVELTDVDTGEVEEVVEAETTVAKPQTSGRSLGTNAGARMAAMRSGSARGASTSTSRTGTSRSRSITTRGTAAPVRTTSVSTRRAPTNNATTARPGVVSRAATITTTTPLYNANNVQSRGSSRVSISARGASIRAASTSSTTTTAAPTADSAIDTTTEMNTMKSLTEYCQAQYASCMDNYCNVLDDNQGRCTCSKNISNYEKTEAALANATEALQDVARSIQYIGLPADQISTLFTETEAELTMKDSKDNSAIRSSLDKVKRMIVEVKSGTAAAVETSSNLNFDLSGLLNFNIDNTGFDLSAFMNTNNTNTNSISNQRGESLYKTAVNRCKASVLNSCTAQGVDAAVVTNAYDLEIDKSCLAYERALTESNKQMSQTVANAKEVLKKARLMVAQNKNSYDLRGCVSALESCMQDDYVCGSGYASCLDPTGQYIVNGSVVVGSMPGNNTDDHATASSISSNYSHENLFETWTTNNKNPWLPTTDANYTPLVDYINDTVKNGAAANSSDKMSQYLQNKIGYHDSKSNKDYGMCMSILNKCQSYTYDSKGKYNPENDVIKQFLQRALVQIKTAQDELLASYAESCISDVSSCLSSNNYDAANPENTKSRTAINSCYAQIRTCMSVNGNIFGSVTPSVLRDWVTGNYTSLETYDSNTNIDYDCAQITDETECGSQRGYCVSSTGAISQLSPLCSWNTSTHKCTRQASCN